MFQGIWCPLLVSVCTWYTYIIGGILKISIKQTKKLNFFKRGYNRYGEMSLMTNGARLGTKELAAFRRNAYSKITNNFS